MKTIDTSFIVILLLLFSSTITLGQDIHLYNQADVDTFDTSITTISGSLIIGGINGQSSDITNLTNLSNITSVAENLSIDINAVLTNLSGLSSITLVGGNLSIYRNPTLKHLIGLSKLTTVGGDLKIYSNPTLKFLIGLSNLTSVGGFLDIFDNPALKSLNSLTNLTYVGKYIELSFNDNLENIQGLNHISTVFGNLSIYRNPSLQDIHGLSSITTVAGYLRISDNTTLLNLDGLSNIKSVGGHLRISDNASLYNLDGLINITSLSGFMQISNNPAITNLDGLSNIKTIDGYLKISNNTGLKNLDGLSYINAVDGYLQISNNTTLQNLNGLSNIKTVGQHINISDNAALSNLDGLSNINTVGKDLMISQNGTIANLDGLSNINTVGRHMNVSDNTALTNCCGIQKLLYTPGAITGSVTIQNNLAECSSEQEVMDSICIENSISGIVFYDVNKNNTIDQNENGIPNIRLSSDIHELILTNNFGSFKEIRDSGDDYEIILADNPMWQLTTDSSRYSGVYIPYNNSNTQKNFGLSPLFEKHKISGYLMSNPTKCNTTSKFNIKVQNNGTYIEDVELRFNYDEETIFLGATPPPYNVNTSSKLLSWKINSLNPFDSEEIVVTLEIPDENTTSDPLDFNIEIFRDSLGVLLSDKTVEYESEALCSIEPNTKLVNPHGVQDDNFTLRDEILLYTIRFQNTGSEEVFDISIIDTLDHNYDLRSFEVVHSSFPVQTTLEGNNIHFLFKNINLSSANQNEPDSHGFVSYEIKIKEDALDYTILENTAHIIFDDSSSIVTNTTKSTMVSTIPVGILEINSPHVYIRPNPATDMIEILSTLNYKIGEIIIYNTMGELIIQSNTTSIDISNISSGLYFIYTKIEGVDIMEKFVKE